MSPDILLVDDYGHEIPLGEHLRPDTDYRVRAIIHNLGRQDATNVSVKFYWRDYGVAESSTFSQFGTTAYISSLTGQTFIVWNHLKCGISSSEGHKCILVNFTHYLDPLTGNEFDIGARHVAQRNLKIEEIEAGGKNLVSSRPVYRGNTRNRNCARYWCSSPMRRPS